MTNPLKEQGIHLAIIDASPIFPNAPSAELTLVEKLVDILNRRSNVDPLLYLIVKTHPEATAERLRQWRRGDADDEATAQWRYELARI